MKKGLILALILVLCLLVVTLSGFLVVAIKDGNKIFTKYNLEKTESNIVKVEKIDINDINKIEIKFTNGKINILESEDENMKIVQYSNCKVDDSETVKVKKDNGKITVNQDSEKIQFMLFDFKKMEYDIFLPKEYKGSLEIETVSGNVQVANQLVDTKDLKVKTTSGNIKYDSNIKAEKVEITTLSGNVKIEKVEANYIYVKTTSGRININSIIGVSDIDSTSGRIEIESYKGNGKLKTISGNIEVKNTILTGNTDIKTISGNVTINLLEETNCEIRTKTVSGKVSLINNSSIYGKAPFNIFNIETTSGNIKFN